MEALILLKWNDPKNKFISVFEAVYLNYQNTSQMCYFGMWICHRGSLSFLNDQYSVVNMYKTTQNTDFADPSLQIPPQNIVQIVTQDNCDLIITKPIKHYPKIMFCVRSWDYRCGWVTQHKWSIAPPKNAVNATCQSYILALLFG